VPNETRDPGLKWRRGSAHFDGIEREWKEFTTAFHSQLAVVPKDDLVELRLQSFSDPPRTEWGLLIGDGVQNFRAALDYMVWILASKQQRADTPQSLEFPIFNDAANYAKGAPPRIGSLPAAAQKVIGSVQPFQQGAESAKSPLWQLHRLSNLDKHRRLHVGQVSLEAVTIDFKGTRVPTAWRAAPPAQRAQKRMLLAQIQEAELRRHGPVGTVQFQPSAFLTIAFEDSEEVTGEGVLGTLRRIRDTVAEVLDQLDPFVNI
jgi:hypothetical protein